MADEGSAEGDEPRDRSRPGPRGREGQAPAAGRGRRSVFARLDPRQVTVTAGERGEWVEDGETMVYMGGALDLAVAQVTSPTGRQYSWEVVRARSEVVGAVVVGRHDDLLLLSRHRFITKTRGLELPTGVLRADENPVQGAERAVLEQAGWSTVEGSGHVIWRGARAPDHSDQIGHLVSLRADAQVGPVHPEEVVHLHWLDRYHLRNALAERRVTDVLTLAAVFWWLAQPGGDPGLVGLDRARTQAARGLVDPIPTRLSHPGPRS